MFRVPHKALQFVFKVALCVKKHAGENNLYRIYQRQNNADFVALQAHGIVQRQKRVGILIGPD